MTLLIKLAVSFLLAMGAFWAFLPGSFGLGNFRKKHAGPVNVLAALVWWLLMLSHALVLGLVWIAAAGAWRWLLLPVALQIVFFSVFGRDVSTE